MEDEEYKQSVHDLAVFPPMLETLRRDGNTIPGLTRQQEGGQGGGRPRGHRRVASACCSTIQSMVDLTLHTHSKPTS